jgi:hypothetical protein
MITMDSPATAGTGIKIGNITPTSGSTGYVVIGTHTSPQVAVRANLDTYVTSGSSGTSCGTDLLLSGGCSCGTNNITSVTQSGTPPTTVACTCSTGTPTVYLVCLRRP